MKESSICQFYHYDEHSLSIYNDTKASVIDKWDSTVFTSEAVNWLNFHSLDDKDIIEKGMEDVGLHPMTVEDIYDTINRPKVEEFENYLYFSIRALVGSHDDYLRSEQISFTLGENFLISFQEKPADHFTEVRDRISKAKGRIRSKGNDYLLYKLLEAIIDSYFDEVEAITDKNEILDKQIAESQSQELFQKIEKQKRRLIKLRKIVFPVRELLNRLEKVQTSYIDDTNKSYFTDLKESCLSVMDELDTQKVFLESITNIYYAAQGQKMNEIMKVLTIVGAIFMPLTFIAGIYGMNFEVMPGTKGEAPFWICIGSMAVLAIIMILYFKKRKWI